MSGSDDSSKGNGRKPGELGKLETYHDLGSSREPGPDPLDRRERLRTRHGITQRPRPRRESHPGQASPTEERRAAPPPNVAPPSIITPQAALVNPHYVIAIRSEIHKPLANKQRTDRASGVYLLTSRKGHSYLGTIRSRSYLSLDEAEYLTLAGALHELTRRISNRNHSTQQYTLRVYSQIASVVRQLRTAQAGTLTLLQKNAPEALTLLNQFKQAEVILSSSQEIDDLFNAQAEGKA